MSLQSFLFGIKGRVAANWLDALTAAVAAMIAWLLAQALVGHPQPVFASIAAMVCLAPGVPSHARQAVGMMLGVGTGIVVGELAMLLPIHAVFLKIPCVIFLAMIIASVFGPGAVIPIQAGVSALLVVLLGFATAGTTRLMDVVVGAGVGLLFSQVLLTPDPVRLIDRAARGFLNRLGDGLAECAAALEGTDPLKAQAALGHLSATHDFLIALGTGITAARHSTRWSVRGRLAAQEVEAMAGRYDRRGVRLYASVLLFGEALANGLRKQSPVPSFLPTRVRRVAGICHRMAGLSVIVDSSPEIESAEAVSPEWRTCLEDLAAVGEALMAFDRADQI